MKICLISPKLYCYLSPLADKPAGGAQRQQSLISSQLKSRGHDVSAIVADYGQKNCEVHDGIELIKGVPEIVTGPLSLVRGLWTLAYNMASIDADVFLVRGAPRLATFSCLIAKILGKRFVFRVANDSDLDPSYLKERYPTPFMVAYRSAVRWSDSVIAQTDRQSRQLSDHFNVTSNVIPNGYDIPKIDKVSSHSDRSYVLWVGRCNSDKKNPFIFAKISRCMPELDFVMVSYSVPGRQEEYNKLERISNSIDNLNLTGPIPPDKIHKYYNDAMILVNTSDYEGFPNTFLEAWRYHTPVVSLSFDLNGHLDDECGGLKADSFDNLINTIRDLSNNPRRRECLGYCGNKVMDKRYSLQKVVDKYENVFLDVLSNK